MKNKSGWGLTEMLVLIGVLMFFFLISLVLIYRFYASLNSEITNTNSVDEKSYYETEEALEHAANRYLDNKYENMNDLNAITIPMEKLESMGYIIDFVHADCTGYVVSSIINGEYISDAYISCDNYKTTGYESGMLDE